MTPMLELQAKIEVSGIMGTSAGALTGSLYAAGMSASQVRFSLKSDWMW
jgi:predicted acylesterase/phospholipase RssA